MKRLNCKLIVSDYDGTLANSNNTVDTRTVEAINEYVRDGGVFAVCTGRILPFILPVVRGLALSGLVVASQGSQIADIKTGKVIRDVCFTPEQTAKICAVLEELETNVQVYDAQGFYSSLPEDEKHLNLYENIIGVTARHTCVPYSEYVIKNKLRCNKVATLCRANEQEELFGKINARLGGEFDVTCSASVLIEVSPLNETKGSALKFLAAHYGVPMEKTCAVGDNLNDLSMVEAAGVGVAVGNAVKGLKDKADFVAATNDEGAVAQVIKKFGYSND
ncbi:MAG: Cof-type HAD-IIB family hydrolase [Clostridia bacterium]|nr:Cof-type HAD-IIB family hydrolase [Clostridia bacterium]